jgi:hypothetical protein
MQAPVEFDVVGLIEKTGSGPAAIDSTGSQLHSFPDAGADRKELLQAGRGALTAWPPPST